ncbi:MAG TPA: reeler domain-containing protein [Patescibacteria group bacterium]|nr:reeler domain-containing protein [Patescibacteria group bacterium]
MRPRSAAGWIALSLSSLLPAAISASSSGSPICHVDQIIGCPMGFPVPVGAGIYTVQVTPAVYVPGETVTISVHPGNTFALLNGLLLYVERPDQIGGDGYPVKVGSFATPLPAGVQAACAFAPTAQVVTHDGGADLALPASFIWTAPPDVHAPLRIRAMLLRAGGEFDWNDAPFEIVSLALPSNDPVFSDSFE